MERQSKGARGLEAYCKGGQGAPRAVAPSKDSNQEHTASNGRANDEMMGLGRKRTWTNWGIIMEFLWRFWGISQEPSVRTANYPAKTGHRNLTNKCVLHFCLRL
jgi:hypothetical protein